VAKEGTYGKLCIDAIVAVVNKENTLSNVTKTQLVDMYTGVVNKWNEVK
jgi:ABC-type phosphate transport system substrate-binding protein